jgi:hypothetical protein
VTLVEGLDIQALLKSVAKRGHMDRVGIHVILIDARFGGKFFMGQWRPSDMRVSWIRLAS